MRFEFLKIHEAAPEVFDFSKVAPADLEFDTPAIPEPCFSCTAVATVILSKSTFVAVLCLVPLFVSKTNEKILWLNKIIWVLKTFLVKRQASEICSCVSI